MSDHHSYLSYLSRRSFLQRASWHARDRGFGGNVPGYDRTRGDNRAFPNRDTRHDYTMDSDEGAFPDPSFTDDFQTSSRVGFCFVVSKDRAPCANRRTFLNHYLLGVEIVDDHEVTHLC